MDGVLAAEIDRLAGVIPAERESGGYRVAGGAPIGGRWIGCYLQPVIAIAPVGMRIDLTRDGGSVVATGSDRIGTFAFSGTIDAAGVLRLKKRYSDRSYDVRYAGPLEDDVIRGVWTLGGASEPGLFAFYKEWRVAPERRAYLEARARPHPLAELLTFLGSVAAPLRLRTILRHRDVVARVVATHRALEEWIA